jgi:Asp-tRNA(Asn)/Glu-tRNA(Gln) amidotransferase A subunit family amidase
MPGRNVSAPPYTVGEPIGEPFQRARERFADGADTPRAYLERRLALLDAREPTLRAFVTLDLEAARRAADASTGRYGRGMPLSEVDGMPIGVKDVIETADLPTQMGSALFTGWTLRRDAACVQALRSGGAIVLGKTVTTEFALGAAGPTVNPWNPDLSPGGSSSGSAAAVAAGLVPAALGTQEIGSLIRPASFCGILGYKPSFGALHQGGVHGVAPSQAHLGALAGSLADLLAVCGRIADAAGGDPGCDTLRLPVAPMVAIKPQRVAMLRTGAWSRMDAAAREAFLGLVERMSSEGVEIACAENDLQCADFEQAAAGALDVWAAICCWEMRWPLAQYRDRHAGAVGEDTARFVAMGERMARADYDAARATRTALRRRHAALAGNVDALLLPSATGPAPRGLQSTGSRDFNAFSSGFGAPALTMPLLATGDLPVGAQLMGFTGADALLLANAAWVLDRYAPALR